MTKLLGSTIVVALAAPAAFAAGFVEPDKEPEIVAPIMTPMAPAYDWTGLYVGVSLGYGNTEWSADTTTTPTIAGGDMSGLAGALHAGYNMDMGSWVTGVEMELAPGALAGASFEDYELDWGARLKLRGGPKLGADGRTFAYGTVGIGVLRISDDTGDDHTDTGWSAGVGVAHAISDSMFVSGEIGHGRFNDVADSASDLRANAASVGLSFLF